MLTIFLASLWGPTLLAIGIGFLIAPEHYKRVYLDIDKNSFALLILTMILLPVGILHVMSHNIWGTFTEGFISFLGWATLAKGVVMAMLPSFIGKAGYFEAKNNLVPFAGILMIVVGMYLTTVAFF